MKKERKRQRRIVIGGYYGYDSTGDEAVLYSILYGIKLRLPDSIVTVLTKDRHSVPLIKGLPVRALHRYDILRLFAALLRADIYISGGGSLLQDRTSKRSLYYYCLLIRLAKLCRTPVFLYANGIGPIKQKKRCARTLRLCDTVSVRDPDSYLAAKSLTDGKKDIRISADPLFSYPFSKSRESWEHTLPKGPYFAVSLRRCAGKTEPNTDAVSLAALYFKNKGYTPVFVSMQDSYDLDLCRSAAKSSGGTVVKADSPDRLLFLLERASFVMGMRLHFLLTAAMAGAPLVGLSYDCKVEGCLKYLGIGRVLDAYGLTCKALIEAVELSVREHSRQEAYTKCKLMKSRSQLDLICLCDLLDTEKEGVGKAPPCEKFFCDT